MENVTASEPTELDSILLIDDDEDQLYTFKALLERTRLRVFVARSVSDARTLLQEKKIRLVVCDVNLPRTNGREFIKEVRLAKEGLPIISFSADSEYPADELLSCGASAFCDKSRSRELLRTVERYLSE
ncbi:MAG: response regulator [Deltaproteobacteria bacterium]|nr:response regulator [Deltaproteobacteria bacterium]